MSKIEDGGGYAFPRQRIEYFTNETSGMTLRDYFAGQVLTGATSHQGGWDSFKHIAEVAYELADAMLAARNKEA